MARQCRHVRDGIVTNQHPDDPYDPASPHASRACCSRPSCVSAAIAWVAGQTNETAHYYDDEERGLRD